MEKLKLYYVTGTLHGSYILAASEGKARRIFHRYYNGESIIHLKDTRGKVYQEVNNLRMTVSQQFEKYVAATKLAELESKGCGELNKFDHLAKDLHKDEFDVKVDKVPEWQARTWRSLFEVELTEAANNQYSE